MTGSITAAWRALQTLNPWFSALWVLVRVRVCFRWGVDLDVAQRSKKERFNQLYLGSLAGAFFIAVINALVLASAVVEQMLRRVAQQ